MLKAVDVANFFIDLANKDTKNEDGMTNMRLNKLVYFAQAFSLVCNNKLLFNEKIEAWEHGPVIPSVYHAFKNNGSRRIQQTYGDFSLQEFKPDEIELLLDVVRNYDQYSSWKLTELTHVKGGPWEMVYKKGIPNITITPESIKDYYSKYDFNRFEFKYNPETDVIGYHDSNNILVLPKEFE